ncbi:unnamed protein product, partial [Ceratitis capitata]
DLSTLRNFRRVNLVPLIPITPLRIPRAAYASGVKRRQHKTTTNVLAEAGSEAPIQPTACKAKQLHSKIVKYGQNQNKSMEETVTNYVQCGRM